MGWPIDRRWRMTTAGERLQRARIDAGLSLPELADRTKIQGWILESIERNEYERLPRGPFIRGFLRAFAREVGLDPAVIVAEYVDALEPQPVAREAPAAAVD